MKACVILFALAATAYAESDPWYGYGYGLPYAGYGYGYALASPCRNVHGAAVPCALGRKKREAEADAKPWSYGVVTHGYGYGYPYAGYGYALSACHNTYGAPVPCAGRKKRAAEAEADPALFYAHAGLGYAPFGAAVAIKPCTNVNGEKVDCALGHKDIATAHYVPTFLYGRKKREADPVYFSNLKAEVTEHEGKYTVPTVAYAHGIYGWPVATVATAEVPYKYNTVAYNSAPVENPADPNHPTLVHTSKLGICLNFVGLRVPC